jgi:MOSC domain-containing protein
MRVLELWRYPVKSLQGERLKSVAVSGDGLEGDRRFALYDLETGLGLTARRVPELLFASARLSEDGGVEITLPDGSLARGDDALSAWLGRPVALRGRESDAARRFENPAVDLERETEGDWATFEGAPGAFHDSPAARVSLVSTATIGPWDRRRFRSNVLLDGDGEDALVGSRVGLGDAVIDVGMRIERCVMTVRAQPGGIERDVGVLRTIAREREACLAVGGLVTQPGRISVGDAVAAAHVDASA